MRYPFDTMVVISGNLYFYKAVWMQEGKRNV